MFKFFRIPFATSGDKTAIPDAADPSGNVSYTEGYGFDYQRQETDPEKKDIERDRMNSLFFELTTAVAELQSQGVPDFITTALNGGSPYSYGQNAIVRYSGALYLSLIPANTSTPADTTKWAPLPTPDLIQRTAFAGAVAGGAANALTATFSPAIGALPAAPGTLAIVVRASAANTTTNPTLNVDGLGAKTIVQRNNVPLLPGSIGGAGHWLQLNWDPGLDRWVLQNPKPALGNKSILLSNITGALVMDLSHLGGHFGFNAGSGSPSATLPDQTLVAQPGTVSFSNEGNVAAVVNAFSGQNIAVGNGATVSSITIPPGGTLTLSTVSSATSWLLEGGSAAAGFDSGNFGGVNGLLGYKHLPGNRLEVNGFFTSSASLGAAVPVVFPLAGTNFYNLTLTPQSSGTSIASAWFDTPTGAGFNGHCNVGGIPVHYRAILGV